MSCPVTGDSSGCQAIGGDSSYQLLHFLSKVYSPCDAPLSRLYGLNDTYLTRVHIDQINFIDLAVILIT